MNKTGPLRPIGLVILRELRERGLSKSYLISWAVLAFLIGVGFSIPVLLGGEDEQNYRVGLTGEGGRGVVERARAMTADADPPVRIAASAWPDRAAAERAVAEGDLDAALVDGGELVVEEAGGRLENLLIQAAAMIGLEELVSAGRASEEVFPLLTGQALDVAQTTPPDEEAARDRRSFISQAALVLLFMAVMMTGSWVLMGVTEEKTSRVAEVLLSAVRPWQVLVGKIAGVGALGLLQFSILVGVIVFGIRRVADAPLIAEINAGLLTPLLIWFVLGYTLYAIAYAMVGAIAARPEDAQNAAFPMTLISLIGYFVSIFHVAGNPGSALSTVLSFIPPTAPFVVSVRTVSDSIPLWQQVAAAAVTIAFALWLLRAAGKIYAGGMFKHRSRVKLREAFRSAEF